mgnify:CR=1 FL=1
MKQIITIGREFGAGGGELGRRLARELGIAYYDRDIILRTAKVSAIVRRNRCAAGTSVCLTSSALHKACSTFTSAR